MTNYLIKLRHLSHELFHRFILSEFQPFPLFIKSEAKLKHIKNNGLFLVKFSTVKCENNNSIIYNYIGFDNMFTDNILVDFILKSDFKFSNLYREWGDFITIIDDSLGNEDSIKDLLSNVDKYNLYYPHSNRVKYQHLHYMDKAKKMVFVNNIEQIIYILKLGCYLKSSYVDLDILGKDSNYLNNYTTMKNALFIIKDLDSLIQICKDNNIPINQGPQRWRGEINSLSSFISDVDRHYRSSLRRQFIMLSKTPELKGRLSRKSLRTNMFSFNNIHKTLGNVRWYSTTGRKLQTSPKQLEVDTSFTNRQELFQGNYNQISRILDNNFNNNSEELQKEIETYLINQENVFSDSKSLENRFNFSKEGFDLIMEKQELLCNILSQPKDVKVNASQYSTKYIPLIKTIIERLSVKSIANILLSYFMKIASYEMITKESTTGVDIQTPGIPSLTAYNEIGDIIYNKYVKYLYSISDIHKRNGSLREFKNENPDLSNIEENFYARIGGYFLYYLISVKLLTDTLDTHYDSPKEVLNYIRVKQEVREILIKNNIKVLHIPQRLPMICEPKEYVLSKDMSKIKLGGYLLNDIHYTNELIRDKIGTGKKTVLREDNIIVDLVNKLSKVPYKVNINTLKFIYEYGISKKILIDDTTPEIKNYMANPYKKMKKKEVLSLRSQYSKIIVERNILSIASIYSSCPKIYFPLRLDFRTRVYCKTDYFDYQKSDLAKGLISFANPGVIKRSDVDAINYFKAYGANMYGNGLDKKSLDYRVKWTDSMTETLLDFENNNIVDKSENKVCFISFCYEFKRFIEFMYNLEQSSFKTWLPIQLDATCNGYQHLVLLTKETKLLNKLNLSKSTSAEDPDDFYQYILDMIEKYISDEIIRLSTLDLKCDKDIIYLKSLKTLKKINLSRSIIKKVTMRESYSASIPSLVHYIITDENFVEHKIVDPKPEDYKDINVQIRKRTSLVKTSDKPKSLVYYKYINHDCKISRDDILVYVMCMKNVIKSVAPKINLLSKYLDDIVNICTKLSIPIPWSLPSGAYLSGSYLVSKEQHIAAFTFTKSKYTFKKYIPGTYDIKKQKRAIRPNLIHSLDGSTIALLHNSLQNVDMFTVHDCFAVTANNVSNLIYKLKMTYIKLYSSNDYLLEFDKLIRINIASTFGEKVFNVKDTTINIPNTPSQGKYKTIPFPNVDNIINITSNKVDILKDSSYIIV